MAKTFCEFFAGVGLVRQGLQTSGWDCVYANDISEQKEELYRLNFNNDQHFHRADVWDTRAVTAQIPDRPFLATASFPCTDLSLAGHWKGLDGIHSSTFFGFAKVVASLGSRKPLAILLENVPGFITSHNGTDFARVCGQVADMGYYLDAFVLDAKHFIPQSRPRVFVIGLHKSLDPLGFVAKPSNGLFESTDGSVIPRQSAFRPSRLIEAMRKSALSTGWLETPIRTPLQSRGLLSRLIDQDENQEWWTEAQVDKHRRMMSSLHANKVQSLIETGETHVGTIYRRKRHGSTKAEVRFDGVAGCLRTPRGGSARQIVIVVKDGGVRMRWMSPREYSRLQGAPNFKLVENRNQNLFAFGDAVCVPVIQWIDKCILTPFYEAHK